MKKLVIFTTALFFVSTVSSFAVSVGDGTSIADTTGGGPGITSVQLSPNVTLDYAGAADDFQLLGVNAKGAIQYGVDQGDPNVYQKAAGGTIGSEATTDTADAGSNLEDDNTWSSVGA
jgi:hypothetical protein